MTLANSPACDPQLGCSKENHDMSDLYFLNLNMSKKNMGSDNYIDGLNSVTIHMNICIYT